MSRDSFKLALVLGLILAVAMTGTALAKSGGKPTTELTNNQSFPVIAADGKSITPLSEAKWTTSYTGPYTGLTAEELAIATGDTWYAQKVTGNLWQGAFYLAPVTETVNVDGMDWGDNIESVSPTIGRPYRLETGLYALVAGRGFSAGTVGAAADNAYGMVMLAYPSSPDEIQGTNATNTYWSDWATITSGLPGLRVQRIEGITSALSWDADANLWYYAENEVAVYPANTAPMFAPELNVAGKYIYGASTGGWKPTALGKYRITFYIPTTSKIDFVPYVEGVGGTRLGNLVNGAWVPQGTVVPEEGTLATPILDAALNLTYVDVVVVGKGGK